MKLKNYTSKVAPKQSIMEIEDMLASMGAKAIQKEYGAGGKVISIKFSLEVNGRLQYYELPSDVDATQRALQDMNGISKGNKSQEQAERTAWRILLDWVHAQLSMVLIDQAKAHQVFLPYALVKAGNGEYKKLHEMVENTPQLFALAEEN